VEVTAAVDWFRRQPGVTVTDGACPDLGRNPAELFRRERAMIFGGNRHLLEDPKQLALLKPEVVWNIQQRTKLSREERHEASREHQELYARVVDFFMHFDLLVTPATPTAPFDVTLRYITSLPDGRGISNGAELFYTEWLRMSYGVTLMLCPAVSVPCGVTRDGRPVGLQLVGKPFGEEALLAVAARFEAEHRFFRMVPIAPRRGTVPLPAHRGPRTEEEAAGQHHVVPEAGHSRL